MPLVLIALALDLTLVFHAVKSGRARPWAFIILAFPGVGAAAYILIELVPEMLGGPTAQQARRRVAARLDPDKRNDPRAFWAPVMWKQSSEGCSH